MVFFIGFDPATGDELWITDGTGPGTRPVKDIAPGPDSSLAFGAVAMGGALYFSAETPTAGGRELWRSDGTEAGTWRVKDINPGPESSEPSWLTPVCSQVFFIADDGVSGRELWRSDGTDAGTLMVADLTPGARSELPGFFFRLRLRARLHPSAGCHRRRTLAHRR